MIKLIDNINKAEISLSDSHYSRIILSHLQTYGTEFDFCEFYELCKKGKRIGIFACLNGSLVGDILIDSAASGVALREVSEFVKFKSPYFAELAPGLTGKTGIGGYQKVKRRFYEITPSDISDGINPDPDLEEVFNTVFPGKESSYGIWLTDTVRRRNRDLLRVYSYNSAVLTVRCRSGGMAYISDVATPPSDRGKGYARALLSRTAKLLADEGYRSYLSADEDSDGFYQHLGYNRIYSDVIFKLKEN